MSSLLDQVADADWVRSDRTIRGLAVVIAALLLGAGVAAATLDRVPRAPSVDGAPPVHVETCALAAETVSAGVALGDLTGAPVPPFALSSVAAERVLTVPRSFAPAVLGGGGSSVRVHAARWTRDLHGLAEELTDMTAARGWPPPMEIMRREIDGTLLQLGFYFGNDGSPRQQVSGVACGSSGWFVFDTGV